MKNAKLSMAAITKVRTKF